jgi:chromosome segregation ATPase
MADLVAERDTLLREATDNDAAHNTALVATSTAAKALQADIAELQQRLQASESNATALTAARDSATDAHASAVAELTTAATAASLEADALRADILDLQQRLQASEAHVASVTAERDAAVQSDTKNAAELSAAAADASAEAEALRSEVAALEQRLRTSEQCTATVAAERDAAREAYVRSMRRRAALYAAGEAADVHARSSDSVP